MKYNAELNINDEDGWIVEMESDFVPRIGDTLFATVGSNFEQFTVNIVDFNLDSGEIEIRANLSG